MEDYTAEMIRDMAFAFCPQCGTAIVPNHKGRPRKYCKECAKLLEHGEVRKIKKQLFCIDCGKPIN